jgi:lipid-binding SYLF domain-containing protein
VGTGGFLIGGGAGSGVVYEHGRHTGFATVEHASVGALAGGETYSELVIVNDPSALEQLKSGRFDFGANASAVIVRTGASTTTTFENGVAVFVEPLRGAMVNASVTGQRIRLTM